MEQEPLQEEIVQENSELTEAKQNFLISDENSTITIMLVEKACEQYYNHFKKPNVPFSYIKFFIEEFYKYSSLFENKLKEFYNSYNRLGLDADDLIVRYTDSYYARNVDTRTTSEDKFLVFEPPVSTPFVDTMRESTNLPISSLTQNILNICKKIDLQDEVLNPAELYENYMIKQVILSTKFNNKLKKEPEQKKKAPKSKKNVAPAIEKDEDTELVGAKIDDNYQDKGKITKVIIPKLNLPSSYPVNYEEPRMLPGKRAGAFVSPSKQIIFINKNKIVNIKYSTRFVEKRRRKPKPANKFNWDF